MGNEQSWKSFSRSYSPFPPSVFVSVVAIPGADTEFGTFGDLDRDASEFAVGGLIGRVVTEHVLRLQLGRDLAEDPGQVFDLVWQKGHSAGLFGQRVHSLVRFCTNLVEVNRGAARVDGVKDGLGAL